MVLTQKLECDFWPSRLFSPPQAPRGLVVMVGAGPPRIPAPLPLGAHLGAHNGRGWHGADKGHSFPRGPQPRYRLQAQHEPSCFWHWGRRTGQVARRGSSQPRPTVHLAV